MHAKWVWSCHENLYKDDESTTLSAQDAGPYLSCICKLFLFIGRLL